MLGITQTSDPLVLYVYTIKFASLKKKRDIYMYIYIEREREERERDTVHFTIIHHNLCRLSVSCPGVRFPGLQQGTAAVAE